MSASKYLAAILPSKGSALQVEERPTPTPGPHDLLIDVKSIALNPIDVAMRDHGLFVSTYPAIIGSDIAGNVIATGSSVPLDLKEGTRVAAFAPSYFVQGAPDNGAFQTRVLVPSTNALPLPSSINFNEGSLLPMAVLTTWSGCLSRSILLEKKKRFVKVCDILFAFHRLRWSKPSLQY